MIRCLNTVPISRHQVIEAMANGLPKPQRKIIHCGVLDFTSGDGCIGVPQWILHNLGLSEGDNVICTNVTLPKGRFVKLQPHTALQGLDAKQRLESALRSFTTLTAKSTIEVSSMDNLKFDILEVKPNRNGLGAIGIVDTDLVVEFEAALDGSSPETKHFERPLVVDTDTLTDEVVDRVEMGQFRFYKWRVVEGVDTLKIVVTPDDSVKAHDVDLYASFRDLEPGSSAENYEFHCVETGAAQIIVNVDHEQKWFVPFMISW